MDSRSKLTPSLPHPDPTVSYWQDPPHPIASTRSTDSLPSSADYVIVGSGISGACIAHDLLSRRPGAHVLMLEARGACSGATGRNGGHTKAASYCTFFHHLEEFGFDEVVKIAKLEYANINETHRLAREKGWDCDSNPCMTVDVIYDEAEWRTSRDAVQWMNEHVKEGVERYRVVEQEEARQKYLCPRALGAVEYPAGSISGYKFVCEMLEECLTMGLNLQTHTPVTALEKRDGLWLVKTGRGEVYAKHVILATNGYSAAICPALQGVIVPLRGQMTAQRPGMAMPKEPLPVTYSFKYGAGYDYMIPRPANSKYAGDIVIGGAWARLPDQGVSEFGETDDSMLQADISTFLRDCTKEYFGQNWGNDHPDGRIRKEWTGIMGNSPDGIPLVGEMPGQTGLWVSAAFNGHGMVLCLKCAEALTSMILGEEAKIEQWFPKSFQVTDARLSRSFEGRRNITPSLPPPSDFMPEAHPSYLVVLFCCI